VGLKDDIYKAFEKNLGKDLLDSTIEGQKKVDELAEDLSKAIINWVQAQTFTITKLNASQGAVPAVTPVGPGTIPMITVKIDDQGQGVDNPMGGGKVESMQSKVQLKRVVEV
jgi:hypothetical protein